MRRCIYIIFFCLLTSLVFGQGKKDAKKDTTRSLDPAGDLYKAATKLMDSLKYKEAIKVYEKAIKKRKNFAEAHNKIAACYIQLNDYENAEKNLEISLKIDPDNFSCTKYLGRTFFQDKKYELAKKYYADAEKIEPNDKELMLYIAELKVAGQDLKGAADMYTSIIFENETNSPQAYIGRGIIKYKLKQYAYAIKDIETGLKQCKYKDISDDIYTDLAEAKFEILDFKSAIKCFDTLLKRNPKNEFALTYRGASKIEVSDFSAAIVDLTEAIKLNSKSYVAYNFRGTAKGGLKQYIEALKDLDQAIKIKFDYASSYVNRASIRMASKDRKGACEDLKRADQLGSDVAYKLVQQYCGGPDY
ncbi:MAG: tetratricopeptide repeat protein [Bacteroidia bacterium]